jgi:hypothetical protein
LAKRCTPNKELLKIFNKKYLEKKLGHNHSSEDPPGSENKIISMPHWPKRRKW